MGCGQQALMAVPVGGIPTANLALWLRASNLALSDGDAVATWSDISGNGNDATQGTAANQPTFREDAISDKAAVFFDGTNDRLTLTSGVVASGDFTAFVVWRRTNNVNTGAIFGGVTDSGLSMAVLNAAGGGDGVIRVGSSGNPTFDDGTTAFPNGGWAVSSFTKSGTTYTQRLNFAANGNGTTAGSPGDITTIGSTAAPASFFTGYITEIIFYTAVLTAGEISAVESYLTSEYGGVIGQVRLLWLEADAILGLSDGNNVARWIDSSGQGVRAIVTTPGNVIYKTNIQNGLPAVRFDTNAASGVTIDSLLALKPYTVYIVYSYRSASAANRRALQGRVNNWLIGPYTNIHRSFTGGFSTGLVVVQNDAIIAWIVGSGSNNTFNVNGVGFTSGGSDVPGTLALGTLGAFAEPLDGDIFEVIIEDRADDAGQQDTTKNYLAAKWNITVV